MKNIPIRHIATTQQEPGLEGNFIIRDIEELLSAKDMVQELHRHDFFFILALKKGKGDHAIDFQSYKIDDNTIFCMRPGQVHELVLKTGSSGYLLQFKKAFVTSNDQSLRKVTLSNFYKLAAKPFKKLTTLLDAILQE